MYWGSLALVRQLHASAKFECIDSHFIYPDGFAAILLGKSLGIPVMVSARGTDMNSYPSFHLIRPMIRWTLRNAAIRIAVSSALKEKMAEVGGADLSIHVITNGVHPGLFHPVPRKEARRRLGLPDEGPLIIAIGSLIEQKGHHTLIRAVRKIVPHYPTVRLYILGHGPYRSTLERLIQTLELEANVYLVGKRPNNELMFWFSAADVSCLASMREGWPNVISESLACGTAVVATRVGGIPEILHSPDLGIIVEQSVESIATGLLQGLSRHWDRELIARKARARTWQTVAEEIEEVLNASIAAPSLDKKVI